MQLEQLQFKLSRAIANRFALSIVAPIASRIYLAPFNLSLLKGHTRQGVQAPGYKFGICRPYAHHKCHVSWARSSDPLPIPEERLPQTAALYDMIYNPQTTKLMKTVYDRGGRSANGLSMLVYQGVRALEIWSDRKIDPKNMKQAANSALASKA